MRAGRVVPEPVAATAAGSSSEQEAAPAPLPQQLPSAPQWH